MIKRRWGKGLLCTIGYILFLTGCAPAQNDETAGDENNRDSNNSIAVPIAIRRALLAPETLFAYVKVDSGAWQAMSLDNNQATAEIANLSLGSHIFTMKFEYQSQGISSLTIAQASVNLTVTSGPQQLSVQESDYSYSFDEDLDGFTNIEEIVANTNPDDANSYPVTDTTPPTVSPEPLGATYTTPINVVLTCDDDIGTGCEFIYFSLDGSLPSMDSSNQYSTPIALSKNSNLAFIAKDIAGNVSALESQQYTFNIPGPTVSAAPRGGIYPIIQTVTLVCDPPGCADIYYTIDDSNPSATNSSGAIVPSSTAILYTSPLAIATSLTIKYFAIDLNNIAGEVFTEVYVIDEVAPETTPNPSNSAGNVYSQNVIAVTLSCTDVVSTIAGSGCATTYYGLDQPTPTSRYQDPISILTSATLYFYSVDAAGRTEVIKNQPYIIDNTPPVTTANPPGGVYDIAQTVVLTCNDDKALSVGSACDKTFYSLNGTTPALEYVVNNPILISSNASLVYYSVDKAGNIESVGSNQQDYVIDLLAPAVSINVPGGTYQAIQNVTLSCDDNGSLGSGCAQLLYSVDGTVPPTTPYSLTNPQPIGISSSLTLNYLAIDKVGRSTSGSETYTIEIPLNCDFAEANGACVKAPHIPLVTANACATGAPRLSLPVGGVARLQLVAATQAYEINCTPHCGDGSTTTILPQETLAQASAEPLIEFFCLDDFNIPAGASFFGQSSNPTASRWERSVAILVNNAVNINGRVDFSGLGTNADPRGGIAGAGGYNGGGRIAPLSGEGPCGGLAGLTTLDSLSGKQAGTGGNGGGFNGLGGRGGANSLFDVPGMANCSFSYTALEGGSGGGSGGDGTIVSLNSNDWVDKRHGGGGGGAILISSRVSIDVAGKILANGGDTVPWNDNNSFLYNALGGGGGGAGGTIVLVAPVVTINGADALQVKGGTGAMVNLLDNIELFGGAGANGPSLNGDLGPDGYLMPDHTGGGGGGGGAGYIRIFDSTSIPGISCSTYSNPASACSVMLLEVVP